MTCPKSVKTAAIVSQAFIIVWAVFSLLSVIFQDSFAGFFVPSYYLESTDKIIPVVTIIYCFKGILLSAANILMCKSRRIHAPLIMTAVTIGVFPIITIIARNIQVDYYDGLKVSDIFWRFSAVNDVESLLSNILSAAAIITVAASAVYAYAKKSTEEKTESVFSE